MAKKAQSTLPNMLLSLTAIALVAAAALAALNGVTKDPIAKAQQAKVENAIGAVLPAFASLEERTVDGHVCHVGLDADGNNNMFLQIHALQNRYLIHSLKFLQ